MLFKNTLAQSASMIAGYVFSFILAPIMIARLGLDAFGVWAVTGAFAMYAGLLDLGITRSLSRFIAVYDAAGDERRIRECVGLGLTAVAIVGAGAALVAALLAPLLSDQLGVLDAGEMRVVVLSAVGIWTFNGIGGVLDAVGIGKRRMVPPNIASAIGMTINFALSIAALVLSTQLTVYALANVAAAAIGILPAFLAMRSLWGRPYVAIPSRELVKEVLGFSLKNQIGWLADLVNFQTDKVIVALVVGVRAAAAYEIASRVVMAARSTAILSISAMIPTTAAEITSRGREVVAEIYRRYTLRTCGLTFPIFVLASIGVPFLLVAWLGEAPGDSALIAPALTIAYLINITTGVGSTIAIGAGNPGVVSANSVLIAAVNVVLTLALAPIFGLWGVVAGTFLAVSFGSVLFTVRFLRLFSVPAGDFFAAVVPTGVLAIGLALPLAAASLVIDVPESRLPATLLLAAVTVAYALPYWILATRRGFLPRRLELPAARRRGAVGTA